MWNVYVECTMYDCGVELREAGWGLAKLDGGVDDGDTFRGEVVVG